MQWIYFVQRNKNIHVVETVFDHKIKSTYVIFGDSYKVRNSSVWANGSYNRIGWVNNFWCRNHISLSIQQQ